MEKRMIGQIHRGGIVEYPTEDELEVIKAWKSEDDYNALLEYVESMWAYPTYANSEIVGSETGEPQRQWWFSTGGWSGNEEIIGALMANQTFWLLHWVSSRRGGHYEFETRAREAAGVHTN